MNEFKKCVIRTNRATDTIELLSLLNSMGYELNNMDNMLLQSNRRDVLSRISSILIGGCESKPKMFYYYTNEIRIKGYNNYLYQADKKLLVEYLNTKPVPSYEPRKLIRE